MSACEITYMKRLCIAASLLACSCAHRPPSDQVQVNEIVRQCGLEGKAEFKRIGRDEVTMIRFNPAGGDEKFMCVAHGLEARGMKLGFEGRE